MKTTGRKKAQRSFKKVITNSQTKPQIITQGQKPAAIVVGIEGFDFDQANEIAQRFASFFLAWGKEHPEKTNGEQAAKA